MSDGAFSICSSGARIGHTEVLLGGTTLLNNLDKTGLELLNGWNVVGEDTHLTGGGGDVDLGPVVEGSSVFRARITGAQEERQRTRQWSGRWSIKKTGC